MKMSKKRQFFFANAPVHNLYRDKNLPDDDDDEDGKQR